VTPDTEPEPENDPVVEFDICALVAVKSAAMSDTTRRSLAGDMLFVVDIFFKDLKNEERRATE